MKKVSYFRRFQALKAAGFVLALALIASSAFAQRAGHWTGTTSQGNNMDLTVGPDGVVTGWGTGVRETCPSGAQPGYGFGFGGFRLPIVDGSFTTDFQLQDGDNGYSVFNGTFTSDTAANGTFYFLSSRFYVSGEDIGFQACEASFTWTATWQSAVGAADNTCMPLDGNQTYIKITSK